MSDVKSGNDPWVIRSSSGEVKGEVRIISTMDGISDSVFGRNLKEHVRRLSDPEWNIIQQSRAYCEFKADKESEL